MTEETKNIVETKPVQPIKPFTPRSRPTPIKPTQTQAKTVRIESAVLQVEPVVKSATAESAVLKLEPKAAETAPKAPIRNMDAIMAKDNKMVRGIFHYTEIPGGTLTFGFRKYKGPIVDWTFKDGEVRTIPLMVAKHINSLGYPKYERISPEAPGVAAAAGAPGSRMRIVSRKPRFSFQNIDFLELDDIGEIEGNNKILTVEKY